MVRNRTTFYVLSFTWGILMTLAGCLVAAALLVAGYRPKKYGYCWYFEVGKGWGGLEMGIFFLVSKDASEHTKMHEHGHGFQNCKYGPAMVGISIASAVRYWYREFKYYRKGKLPPTSYDSVWFEGEATKLGTDFMSTFKD